MDSRRLQPVHSNGYTYNVAIGSIPKPLFFHILRIVHVAHKSLDGGVACILNHTGKYGFFPILIHTYRVYLSCGK
jgi:hypothetical protein